MDTFLIIVGFVLLLLLPPVIIGELVLNLPRKLPYRDLPDHTPRTTKTSDNVRIHYWISKHKYSTLLIIVHGHRNHSRFLYNKCHALVNTAGIDSLYLDLRNHGRSGIKPPVSIGATEYLDVLAILQEVKKMNQAELWDRVYLFGTSMGAVSVMLAENTFRKDQETYQQVEGLFLDSVFLSHKLAIRRSLLMLLFPIPWIWLIMIYLYSIRMAFSIQDLTEVMKNLDHPTVIFRGSWDLLSRRHLLQQIDELQNPHILTVRVARAFHSRLFSKPEFQTVLFDILENEIHAP